MPGAGYVEVFIHLTQTLNYPADLDEPKWVHFLQIMPPGPLTNLLFVHTKLPLLVVMSVEASLLLAASGNTSLLLPYAS